MVHITFLCKCPACTNTMSLPDTYFACTCAVLHINVYYYFSPYCECGFIVGPKVWSSPFFPQINPVFPNYNLLLVHPIVLHCQHSLAAIQCSSHKSCMIPKEKLIFSDVMFVERMLSMFTLAQVLTSVPLYPVYTHSHFPLIANEYLY